MKEYTFDDNTVSDLHKDAFGFRPSQSWWGYWAASNPDGKQAEWDGLIAALERRVAEDKAAEERAVVRFEALVNTTTAAGAKDRTTALQWLMDGSDCGGDWDYFAWTHGLPYRYFAKQTL